LAAKNSNNMKPLIVVNLIEEPASPFIVAQIFVNGAEKLLIQRFTLESLRKAFENLVWIDWCGGVIGIKQQSFHCGDDTTEWYIETVTSDNDKLPSSCLIVAAERCIHPIIFPNIL